MTDYTELVKALTCGNDGKLPCHNNECPYWVDQWHGIGLCNVIKKDADAADAIEALSRLVDLNTERCEGLRKQLREAQEQYEKNINELGKELSFSESTYEEFQIVAATQNALLAKQLPKRGEWEQVEVIGYDGNSMNDDAARCSVCGHVEQSIYWARTYYRYCPNCGAKMEVQDDKA